MDSERPTTVKIDERPISQLRRNLQDSDGSRGSSDRPQTGVPKLKSRTERPTSRRGLKNDIQDFNIVASTYQAGLLGRNYLSRPPSVSISSNLVSTTNSRLNSAIKSTRLNTGRSLNSFETNVSCLDRPVTQQGVAAFRPSSTRGLPRMTRQIQDKRYFEGLIQLKIGELTHEILTIAREIDAHNKERVTFLHYDQQAKDLASELTNLQGKLADYNIIVDKMTSDSGRSAIEQETCERIQSNDFVLSEIEVMFDKRHHKDKQFRATANSVDSERKNAERIVESMDPQAREKYGKLHSQKTIMQENIDKMQHDSDNLSVEKISLEERIALSQMKQEAVRLQTKIMEIEEKRDRLREEEKNQLSPEEEKDHLLQKVKQDNVDIAASERRISETEKRITEVEQEIEELEVDLNEDRSERLIKFKELRKREKAMEEFIVTFEENKMIELEKLKTLKAVVDDRLKRISSEMDGEVQLTDSQQLEIFDVLVKENHKKDQNLNTLQGDHVRLQRMLLKMEKLEKRLKTELKELERKIEKCQTELVTLEDLDGLKVTSKMKHNRLLEDRDEFKIQEPSRVQELQNVQLEYNEIKGRLDENEAYLQIHSLENKLEKLKESSLTMQNSIIQKNERMNYSRVKEHTFTFVARYNIVLTQIV